jgi:holliday junction DNA helicase RuvA
MIGYLKGRVIDRGLSRLILEVSGVGYEVNIPSNLDLSGDEIELFIHTHVREDQISLFGFKMPEEISFFKLLLSVSGIGPKVALAILGSAPLERLMDSISKNDPSLLSAVSGVGKKTAEKAIIELKGKIGSLDFSGGDYVESDSTEIIEALLGLGFLKPEIVTGLKSLPTEISDNDEKIKWLIKNLGKK